jgi:hypothetical protein
MSNKARVGITDLPKGLAALFAHGSVKAMRQAQYEQAQMRGLAPLWQYSNEFVDDAINRIGREGLIIASDRIDQAAVSMPNWLSILELTSHKVGESRAAQRGMVPGALGEHGIQDKTPYTIPIYVTWDEFGFNARELAAAERAGRPLDTDEVEQAVRNVNYAIEDAIISGGPTVGGNSSPGLSSTTNTATYGSSEAWDASGHSGQDILDDVLSMRAVLSTDKFYGPYTLYVSTVYGAKLQNLFSDGTTTQNRTIQNVLESLEFGGRNLRVRTADLLSDDQTYLAQDTADVVDVIVGQQPVAINPAPEVEWYTKWTVFAVIVPRVKSDYDSNFGVCSGNTA